MAKPDLSALQSLSKQSAKNTTPAVQLANLETELQQKLSAHPLEDTTLSLSIYLKAVEMTVKQTFNHHVWVKAEIRNLSTKGGHYYFELAEKDDLGKVIASCRGNLWRFKAQRLLNKFLRATGMQLNRDLTVLLKVTASVHPLYGFALTIEDIDPSYTLGDLAQQYAAMVDRLVGEGLIDLNKQLATPFDIEHVLVIAPENAAGLGDFRAEADHLQHHNACQFHYHHATFQGNHAPAEIRHAIIEAQKAFYASYQKLPDLLVIIRGGGAVGDLAYLNDYELAALVAEQPIPVWVGVGHERDKVILDEVAHSSFDTPSKVIAAIIHHLKQLVDSSQRHIQNIQRHSQQQLKLALNRSQRLLEQLAAHSQHKVSQSAKDCSYAMNHIKHMAKQQVQYAQTQNQQLINNIHYRSQDILKQVNNQIAHDYQRIVYTSQATVKQAAEQCQHLRSIILLQHPKNLLNQGYAILSNPATGKTLTSCQQLSSSQRVSIQLQDGQAVADIVEIK